MNCNFGAPERIKEMLRDRLVYRVNHQGIQWRLLSEGDLTYKHALTLAQSIQCAESDAKKLGSTTLRLNDLVHLMQPDHKPLLLHLPTITILLLLVTGVEVLTWPTNADTKTLSVGIARKRAFGQGVPCKVSRFYACPEAAYKDEPYEKLPTQEEPGQHESTLGDEYSLNAVQGECASPPPFTLSLKINGTPVEMEVDTGAAISILNKRYL